MKRVHVLLIVFVLCLVVFFFHYIDEREVEQSFSSIRDNNWLVNKYGPKRYSWHFEELIIRDFFQDRRNGFFVDIGANHYQINSNTFFLERSLGWKGIAVDALSEFEADYVTYRKNTSFFHFFVGDKSDKEVDFYVMGKYKGLSSGLIEVAQKQKKYEKIKVPTITLDDLLERAGVNKFDFLSMDIEMSEPAALAGFNIKKYRPSLVCIEAHEPVREKILDYFQRNDYVQVEKYREMDSYNLYFTPKDKQ